MFTIVSTVSGAIGNCLHLQQLIVVKIASTDIWTGLGVGGWVDGVGGWPIPPIQEVVVI